MYNGASYTLTPTNNINSTTECSERKQQLCFSQAQNLLWLKSVLMSEAHVAPHEEAHNRFKHAGDIFVTAAPSKFLYAFWDTNWKSLSDKV